MQRPEVGVVGLVAWKDFWHHYDQVEDEALDSTTPEAAVLERTEIEDYLETLPEEEYVIAVQALVQHGTSQAKNRLAYAAYDFFGSQPTKTMATWDALVEDPTVDSETQRTILETTLYIVNDGVGMFGTATEVFDPTNDTRRELAVLLGKLLSSEQVTTE